MNKAANQNSQNGYVADIEQLTLDNQNFRQVLYTAPHSQLVLMTLQPKEDIGEETHHDTDQFLRIEEGHGRTILNGKEYPIKDGSAVVVPAGVKHNIINDSDDQPLKLYTLYAPPHHRDQVIHDTKKEALADHEHFDGNLTN